MSAPALTPRPAGSQRSRPTRPVARVVPARAPQTRAGSSRAGSARTGAPVRAAAAGRPSQAPGPAARPGAATSARALARGAGDMVRGAAGATVGATALALPVGVPSGLHAGGRTRMRVLERPRSAGRRVGFAVTCTAVLGALMLGLLLLNVAISGNAFTAAELQSERDLLVDQQQSLEQQLLVNGSPEALATRARALGMVPAPQVLVLAPDGTGAPPAAPAPSP